MAETHISRPRVACEVSADRVVTARAGEGSKTLEAAVTKTLPEGALTPGLQQANVNARDALVAALRDSLTTVAGRVRDICLVIPDATTRVMLLDMETLPEKPQDADAVVRFRLKKSLPFDVDQSSVSFDRQGTANPMRVVAAVTPRTVLEEYESLIRDAGYNPGLGYASMLAALGVVDASRPTMVIKVEHGTTTFAIVDQNQLLLYRALENGGVAVTGDSLVDDVNTSLVYFEDRYTVGVDRVLVAGVQSAQALQEALNASSQHSRGRVDFQHHVGRSGGRQCASIRAGWSHGSPGLLMRLNINLASQPYEVARQYRQRMTASDRRSGSWLRWCCWATLFISEFIPRTLIRQLAEMQQQIDGLDREEAQARAILNKPANRVVADQADFLNELFARKALSWTRIFTEMERIVPPELHVVSMKPDYTKTNDLVLHMVVATDSRDRAVELVRHLEKSNHFRQPQVVAETVVANTSAQASGSGNIQFDIAAVYVPGTQDDQAADSDEQAAEKASQPEKTSHPRKPQFPQSQ